MNRPLLLSRNEIDDGRWNTMIANSGQEVIYGYSWYLDVVCDQWKALVWPSAEEYRIVMPLPVTRKWTVEVIRQPLFCQYLGLFSLETLPDACAVEFLRALTLHFPYISSYGFHPSNTATLRALFDKVPLIKVLENQTFLLDLSKDYEKVNFSYTPDRRVNLGRSLKESWVVDKSGQSGQMIALFRENHASQIPGGVRPKAYQLLERVIKSVQQHQSAEIWYASKEGVVHAGVLFIRSGRKVIYLFNACDQEGRQGNARTYLLDRYFREHCGNPYVFDFESPQVPAIASFYQSFGATPSPYFFIRKNELPFPFKQIQHIRLKWLSIPG